MYKKKYTHVPARDIRARHLNNSKLPMVLEWLTRIMDYANRRSCKIVLGLDSNAHSELYGRETDQWGEISEEFIFQNGLEVENRGDIPTFYTIRRGIPATSFIYITLSKHINIVDWQVDESFNNSDHNTLTYEIIVASVPPKLIRPWKRANWTRFSRILAAQKFHFPELMTIKKIDKLVNALYEALNFALNKFCPLRPAKSSDSNLKWWSTKLKNEAKKLNKQHLNTLRLSGKILQLSLFPNRGRMTTQLLSPSDLYHFQTIFSKPLSVLSAGIWINHYAYTLFTIVNTDS